MEDNVKSIGGFLLVFIAIIVGLAIMSGGIYPEIGGQIEKTNVRNTTVDLSVARIDNGTLNGSVAYYYPLAMTNTTAGWRNSYSECLVSTIILLTPTNTTATADTDYTWTAADGKLLLKNTFAMNGANGTSNISKISYVYCGDKYVGGAVNRTLVNLIPIFLALAVALIALWPVLQSKVLGED